MARESFAQVVALAIADIAEHGFDSEQRIQAWVQRIRQALHLSMGSTSAVNDLLRRSLTAKYNAALTGAKKYHRGLDRFTLARVAPAARAELDRRIVASAQLIRLNREEAIQKTMRRFVGWSTSVPAGGSDTVEKREEARDVKKALGSLPFETRRVLIDQGHKLTASVNQVIATHGGAIAVEWCHILQTTGYQPRPEHLAINGNIYLIDSWATEKGLVKPGKYGWYRNTDGFAVLPYCSCFGRWIYRLSALPDDMLTAAGRDVVARAQGKVA